MTVYLDTSALAKLVLIEPGTDEMRSVAETEDLLACASIGYVELRAAVAAARRDGRIEGTASEDVALVDGVWDWVSEIELDTQLLRTAGDLSDRARLRAYDAVHFAALVTLGPPELASFACWDQQLRRAAADLGYPLIPERLP